jgi:putative spermidine/putrescine transport system permease protein
VGRTPAALLAGLAAPGLAAFGFFFVLPLAVVGAEAFTRGLGAFRDLAAAGELWPGLRNSFGLGFAAGLVSLLVGLPVAARLARMGDGPRTALMFIIALPLTFSGLIVAFGFILAFGRAGFVTLLLARWFGVDPAAFAGFVYSPWGLAFVYAYYLIPRVVMLMLPVFQNFDRAQLRAAASLGAGGLLTWRLVVLPQLAPSALAAFCLVSAVAIGAYGTALALVGTGQVNILPLWLFTLVADVNTDFPLAAALALVLTAACSLVMAVAETLAARAEVRARG